ncbi:uncharacterized protein HKW66_Vig0193410 [Vigna angularis]|uniref:Uncharacterized protein n=1 Tax=Phaseolus angularis TaxID=3914 RepID=A0A8T0KTK7_PHAAN|nr:uncharacterized protein HKW66_Vig0193410 [Vigna angularis]
MAYNNLSGELTDCWNNWKSLVLINLGHNNLKVQSAQRRNPKTVSDAHEVLSIPKNNTIVTMKTKGKRFRSSQTTSMFRSQVRRVT